MNSSGASVNVAIVAQGGRIGYQALLCAASVRHYHSAEDVRIFVCTPNNSSLWEVDPAVTDPEVIGAFGRYDCEITPFDNAHFGSSYPHSNKFYAILSLPPDEPFLFLDSDTVLIRALKPDDFNFAVPGLKDAAPFWPIQRKDKYTIAEIWQSLYQFFDLDGEKYRDERRDPNSHLCYPYYQGNVFYYKHAGALGKTMLEMALRLWQEHPKEVKRQPLKPWLDQIVLPLALARLGIPRRSEPDPITDVIAHYQFPMYLLRRDGGSKKHFAELCLDTKLVSILERDAGFKFYLSREGREFFRDVNLEFAKSGGERGNRRVFTRFIRDRAPVMR